MRRCLLLAQKGEVHVAPNPMVGCVIVYNDEIVAEGYHARYGEEHAEVMAFRNLPESVPVTECDVYVNLEPCSHYGKTPPCADLLISKRPNRLIIGMLDPNKLVAGSGVKKILEAGLDVKIGVLEDECNLLNKKFIKAHTQNKPYVTLKWAETKNGYMAREHGNRESRKISNEKNNTYVHHLRASHQAILVGANTVNIDDPLLDVRFSEGNNPLKVVLSPEYSVQMDSQLFMSGESLVYTKIKSVKELLYEVMLLDNYSLSSVLADLHRRGIHSVLVEGGPRVLQAFIDAGEWDEAIVLCSLVSWEAGIKAPRVGFCPHTEKLMNNDIIKEFKPE